MIELRYLCHHRFTAAVKGDRYHGLVSVARQCPACEPRTTVLTKDAEGHVRDTHLTEQEHNGWRITRA